MNHIHGDTSQTSSAVLRSAGGLAVDAPEPPHPSRANPLKPVAPSSSDLRFIANDVPVAVI